MKEETLVKETTSNVFMFERTNFQKRLSLSKAISTDNNI